jgi:hypothetical protein
MRALGRLFDIGCGWAPVDLDTANAATGKRLSLANASGVTFVVNTAVGAADDLVLDVQQHTAYTGGTTADLDTAATATATGVLTSYIKAETALDNDEAWVAITQTDASEVTIVGATYGAQQKIIVIEVDAAQLADGYTHVSLNAAVTTGAALLGSCLYIVHGLSYPKKPTNLPNLLNPGAVNV